MISRSAWVLSKAFTPKEGGIVALMVMLVKLVQPSNAKSPIIVTLAGMMMLSKLAQLENANSPILVTLAGMLMLSKLVQLENTLSPILLSWLP
jgi:glutamine amidotransferase PdxT